MTKREAMRQTHQEDTLRSLGFSREEAEELRRISMVLHRWFEHECNGDIQRDEATDVPYWYNTMTGKRIYRAPDREKGAQARLARIMAAHPTLSTYVQSDPRGAALYIIRPGDVPEGQNVDSYYSRGVCVY